jgi:hypothetical protein
MSTTPSRPEWFTGVPVGVFLSTSYFLSPENKLQPQVDSNPAADVGLTGWFCAPRS